MPAPRRAVREALELETPHGLARVHLRRPERPVAALVLGHGAGGGVEAPDLVATAGAATHAGFSVGLVEQPYRVAGRRNQPPARQLDAAWLAVLAHLRAGPLSGLALVVGGRSAGARVACRTAAQASADAVLCLAFPLHPPGKADDPSKSRLGELDAVRVPVLIIQGQRDPFGMPPPGRRRTIVRVPGTHALRATNAIETAVRDWLPRSIAARGDQPATGSRSCASR
jgi:predicted alpha/beta-hydrolase family hydrolase